MKELSELEKTIFAETARMELRDANKRKQIFDSIMDTKPSDAKVVQFKRYSNNNSISKELTL